MTPFPVLLDDHAEPWFWPKVPFDWRHSVPADETAGQPCRLDIPGGSKIQGFFFGLDPIKRSIGFGNAADAKPVDLPFARFNRLVLATPLRSVGEPGRTHAERFPRAAQVRELRLRMDNGVLRGRICGHVETDEGLFFFSPGPDDYSLLRNFVPRSAYLGFELGTTALEAAAEKWIRTPEQLFAAVAHQRHMSIAPIGQAMLELGIVTQEQLERALAQPNPDKPLGERMVQDGLISRADLHTAIAHKMGYPYVDLARFPIDPVAARKLPLRVAVQHRALPILLDRERLFIAVDRPARTAQLSGLYALAAFEVVPVLAAKSRIMLALSALADQDIWREHVKIQANFFDTTT